MNKTELMENFSLMGVNEGATVLVHSSFKALGAVEGGPNAVIDSLVELITPEGTLLFPTFNFTEWTEAHYFDIKHTPSRMGILTETARQRPGFERSKHPVYSFAVFGSLQNEFLRNDSPNCFGSQSIFSLIHQHNTLMLSLGLDFNSTFSLTHHVETMSGACTYRYEKSFSGVYVGLDGNPSLKTYTMFVRDLSKGVETDIVPAMTDLVKDGCIQEHRIGSSLCHYAFAKPFYNSLTRIVREFPHKLHRRRY